MTGAALGTLVRALGLTLEMWIGMWIAMTRREGVGKATTLLRPPETAIETVHAGDMTATVIAMTMAMVATAHELLVTLWIRTTAQRRLPTAAPMGLGVGIGIGIGIGTGIEREIGIGMKGAALAAGLSGTGTGTEEAAPLGPGAAKETPRDHPRHRHRHHATATAGAAIAAGTRNVAAMRIMMTIANRRIPLFSMMAPRRKGSYPRLELARAAALLLLLVGSRMARCEGSLRLRALALV